VAVRPLKELLKEAERFALGLNKQASVPQAAPDEILDLAKGLIEADEVSLLDSDFEKTAMALNRAEALLQIQTLQKLAQFEAKAIKAGYSNEQVNEVVEKISAAKLKDNLKTLTAIEGVVIPGPDVNSLKKKKVPTEEVGQPDKGPTKSMGYGL
jgi:hypothetical protein